MSVRHQRVGMSGYIQIGGWVRRVGIHTNRLGGEGGVRGVGTFKCGLI